MVKNKEKVGMSLDIALWKRARKHCIDKNIKYSDYVEDLIKKDLKKK